MSTEPTFLDTYTRCQPELVRNRWHQYVLGDEPPRPGITTITGKKSKGDALQYWAAGCAATYVVGQVKELESDPAKAPEVLERLKDWNTIRGQFNQARDNKADVGSQFHLVAQRYAEGKPVQVELLHEEVRPRALALLEFFRQVKPRIVATEFPVFNDTFWYAGTLDCLAVIDGETWLLDYKTSETAFEPREGGKTFFPEEYAMQLMAGAMAEFIYDTERCIKIPMPKIDRIGSINARVDKVSLWEWPKDDAFFHTFLGLRKVWELEKKKLIPARRLDVTFTEVA